MPIIPLIRGGSSVKTVEQLPTPALDHIKRPRVDLSGIIAGQKALTKASRMPRLPDELAEPAGALDKIGKAISYAGQVYGSVHDERQAALLKVEQLRSSVAFDAKKAEFEAWRGTEGGLVPEQWVDRWDQTVAGFEPISADSKLSEKGKQILQLEVQATRDKFRQNLGTASTKAIFANAGEALVTQAGIAYENGDQETGDSFLDAARGRYIHDFVIDDQKARGARIVERRKRETEVAAERAEFDRGFSIVTNDPFGWQQANPKPWPGKEQLWQRLKNSADARKHELTAAAADGLANGISDGTFSVPGEIDALEDKSITPVMREKAKALLSERKQDLSDARRNGPEGWAAVPAQWLRVRQWRADPNKPEEMMQIIIDSKQLPDDMRGEITQLAHQKFGSKGATGELQRPEAKRLVSQSLETIFKPIRDRATKRDQFGDAVLDAQGNEIVDQGALLDSYKAEAKILEHMSRWRESHPEASLDQTAAELQRAVPSATRSSALDALRELRTKSPTAGNAITPAGVAPGPVEPVASVPPGVEPPPVKPKTKREREIEAEEERARRNQRGSIPLPDGGPGPLGNPLLPDLTTDPTPPFTK